ncbi:MAG TPA: hypothetical protein VFH78_07820, partial [Candidatus Thermoplasmatota archaeon]|nr:hypothetical protein [Candidatus Thermoplasmatota archaeon]
MWPRRLLALGALLALLAAPHAGAHGGRAQPGDTLERATLVAAPARLFEEGVVLHYYRVELGAPTTLRVRLAAPPHAPPGEAPMLLVFGPGLPEEGVVPAGVQRPGEGGVVSFLAAGGEERVDARLGVRWLVLLERELPLEAGTHHVVVHAAQATPLALLLDAPAARKETTPPSPGR